MKGIWASCDQPIVIVTDPDQRTSAQYPASVIYGDEGSLAYSGDTNPAIWYGYFKIETYTRQSPACQLATSTLYEIKNRQALLINGITAQNIVQLRGTN